MEKRIWVALPDGLIRDEPTLREKTEKLGWIGRSLAIFGVDKLFIYHDLDGRPEDAELMKLLLEYMETPPYLRRTLFPIREELKYAGLLPPLRTPHHAEGIEWDKVAPGIVREAVIVKEKGAFLVEAGLSRPVEFDGIGRLGERLTVTFTRGAPNPRCRRAEPEEINFYAGYSVALTETLGRLIRSSKPDLCVSTSRLGDPIDKVLGSLTSKLSSSQSVLISFGSPHRGLHEIASAEGWRLEQLSDFVVNLFPKQRVTTIRTEEALLASLTVINIAFHSAPT